MMSRQGSKTYGKNILKESSASRAFDKIFTSKCIRSTAAKAQVLRWGQASFTSRRDTQAVSSSNGESTLQQDPFSFDSEDSPASPKKRRGKYGTALVNPQMSKECSVTPENVIYSKRPFKKRQTTPKITPSSIVEVVHLSHKDDKLDVKMPVKTYSRTPKSTPPARMPVLKLEEPSLKSSSPTNDLLPMEDMQLITSCGDFVSGTGKSTMPVLEPFTEMSYEQSAKLRNDKLASANRAVSPAPHEDSPIRVDIKTMDDQSYDSGQEVEIVNRYKTRVNKEPSTTIIRVCPPSWYTKQQSDKIVSNYDAEKEDKDAKLSDEAKMRKMQREIDELLAGEEIIESPKKPAAKVRKFFRSRNRDQKHLDGHSVDTTNTPSVQNRVSGASSQDVDDPRQDSSRVGDGDPSDSVSTDVASASTERDDQIMDCSETDDRLDESAVNLSAADEALYNSVAPARDVDHKGDSDVCDSTTREKTSVANTTASDAASEGASTQDSGVCEGQAELDDGTDFFDLLGDESAEESTQVNKATALSKQDTIEISSDASVPSSLVSSQQDTPDVTAHRDVAPAAPTSRLTKPSSRSPKPADDNKFFKSKNGSELKVAALSNDLSSKRIFSSPKKLSTKAAYNVRTWQEDSETSQKHTVTSSDQNSMLSEFDEVDQNNQLVSRAVHWPKKMGDEAVTSLHVKREHKELFTVVRNVKQAHECQESGETQEFTDDIEYLLTGLPSTEPLSSRCLSCISFCTKCLLPAFRMHLRAHAIYTTIFNALQDAHVYPSLSLCTSLLLFMMSRDRINHELDTDVLNLMLQLLGVNRAATEHGVQSPSKMAAPVAREYGRMRDKVRELLEKLDSDERATMFDYDDITSGNLVMEALLSLTAKRTGVLFKEELRVTGALDHITDTVCQCVDTIQLEGGKEFSDVSLELLRKVERCLRVLENATYSHAENQAYLVFYEKAQLMSSLSCILSICTERLPANPVEVNIDTKKVNKESLGWTVFSCVLSVLKVLLNVTHGNDLASTTVGKQDKLLATAINCVVSLPNFVQCSDQFDLLILSMGLLINLCENCETNRYVVFTSDVTVLYNSNLKPAETKSFVSALIELFQQRDEAARVVEESGALVPSMSGPAAIQPIAGTSSQASDTKGGVWKESKSGLEWVVVQEEGEEEEEGGLMDQAGSRDLQVLGSQEDDDNFTKALHRAGRHMEDSIVAAYVAILIGFLIQGNQEYMDQVKEKLPEEDFVPMITMLRKFYGFVNLTSAIGSAGNKSLIRVIEVLESC